MLGCFEAHTAEQAAENAGAMGHWAKLFAEADEGP